MAVATGTALLGAAAISGGLGIANSLLNEPEAPSVSSAPPPASYYAYDSDGNLTGSQVWDAGKNAYVYTAGGTAEQKAQASKTSALKTQLLNNLWETPADRLKAYDDYAKAYSTAMHTNVDYQYNQNVQATAENMNRKGMLGSKAYVDTMADLNRTKGLTDTAIANEATMAKEALANQDKATWLSELGYLDSNEALGLEKQRLAAAGAQSGTSATLAGYNATTGAQLQQYGIQSASNQALTNNLLNTSSGLAYLYGYGKRGGGSGSGGGTDSGFSVGRGLNLTLPTIR